MFGRKRIRSRSRFTELRRGFRRQSVTDLHRSSKRASASIGANLAEGCGRDSDADFRRFVQIASGSACEVEYHLLLANDLGLLPAGVHQHLDMQINEVKRMLVGLSRFLEP
jgi:four helix bundle protein